MRFAFKNLIWFTISVSIIIFVGCAQQKKTKKEILAPLKTITLTKNLTIPSKVDSLIIGYYGMVAVDHRDHIFAADPQNQRILEFNKQGHFIRQIGRKGSGPGEFRRIGSVVIRNDSLYVKDNSLRHIDIFHLPQAIFVRTISLPVHIKRFKVPGSPMNLIVLNNGFIGIHYENPMKKYKSASKDFFYWLQKNKGIPRIPIPVFQGYSYFKNKRGKFFVFMVNPTKSHAVIKSKGNQFFLGNTDSLKITSYHPDGSPVITYKLNIPPPKVTPALMDTILKHRHGIRRSKLRNRFPVYRNFWISDTGRVWVLLENPERKQHYVIIFNADGKPIGKTRVPKQFEIECIRNHSLYGIWRNKNGMSSVVRYSVKFS